MKNEYRYLVMEFSDAGDRFIQPNAKECYYTNDISEFMAVNEKGNTKMAVSKYSIIIVDLVENKHMDNITMEWQKIDLL